MASKIQVEVTMPKTLEGMQALQERINMVHAKAIVSVVDKLNCSYEAKVALLNRVMNSPDKEESTLDRFLREHPEMAQAQ